MDEGTTYKIEGDNRSFSTGEEAIKEAKDLSSLRRKIMKVYRIDITSYGYTEPSDSVTVVYKREI